MKKKVSSVVSNPCFSRKFFISLFILAGFSAIPGLTGCGSGDYSLSQSSLKGESVTSSPAFNRVKTSVIVGDKNLQAVGGSGTVTIPESLLSVKMEVQNISGAILQSMTKNVLVDANPLIFEFEFTVGQVRKFFAYGFDAPDGAGNKTYEGHTANPVEVSVGMNPVRIGLVRVNSSNTFILKNVTLVNSGSTATLSATINPLGSGMVAASFDWGLTSNSGSPEINNQIVSSGTSDVGVSHTIQGLLPGTEYFFNITAQNDSRSVSVLKTFVTPVFISSGITFPETPAIASLTAINITGASATLKAEISPNGAASTLFFDWGTTNSYGNSSLVSNLTTNLWSATPHAISYDIANLQPGTKYYIMVTTFNSESLTPVILATQFTTTN